MNGFPEIISWSFRNAIVDPVKVKYPRIISDARTLMVNVSMSGIR